MARCSDAPLAMAVRSQRMALSGMSIRQMAPEKQGQQLKALLVRMLEKTTREPTGEGVGP